MHVVINCNFHSKTYTHNYYYYYYYYSKYSLDTHLNPSFLYTYNLYIMIIIKLFKKQKTCTSSMLKPLIIGLQCKNSQNMYIISIFVIICHLSMSLYLVCFFCFFRQWMNFVTIKTACVSKVRTYKYMHTLCMHVRRNLIWLWC